MTTPNLPTGDGTTTAAAPTCDACDHGLAAHDVLGLRFCAATVAAALTRRCICR